jgi:hypothetical protein
MIMKHNAINYLSVREAAAAGILRVGKEYGETSQARREKRDKKQARREKRDENHERRDSESETRDETCQGHGTSRVDHGSMASNRVSLPLMERMFIYELGF